MRTNLNNYYIFKVDRTNDVIIDNISDIHELE